MNKCPGQDSRKAQAESITCINCGYLAEIFSDEIKVKCPKCKHLICKERLPSCVDWCKAAKECIGEANYKLYAEGKAFILKDKLIKELEDYFGSDAKRIAHAKKVMGFAENILKQEKADWNIVIPASILHDVGIKLAEEKYGSNAGYLQEKEGPEIAGKILLKLGVKKEDINEICQIIACHHSPGEINTINFKVLYDADWLVNLRDELKDSDQEKISGLIDKVFLTKTGRDMAKGIYCK
jgi:HD superfamily phosphohydrolase YqeK